MSNSERLIIVLNDQFLPPKEFTEKRLSFGDAQVSTDNDRNTKLEIDGIPGKGYYGAVEVYYNRLVLTDYLTSFSFRSDQLITKETVVTSLAARYGLEISPDDFVDVDIPVLGEGENTYITLEVKPESIQWVGSIQCYLEYGKAWLDASVTQTSLDRLAHPNPAPTKAYGKMATWGYDFSGIQTALKPTSTGDYADWGTVATLCAVLGIPQWVKGKVIDQPTSAVPGSNTDFQRVVIQNQVISGLMQGPLYFHYNPF